MNPITDLTNAFKKFPGLGNKSASRIVFYLLKQNEEELNRLGSLIANLKKNLKVCSDCGNLSYEDLCPICSDPLRDRKTLCIVEDIEALNAFEQAKIYNGLYHVLGGQVSPLSDQDISEESAKFLLKHIKKLRPSEIIIATSPTVEGDMTKFSLMEVLKNIKNAKITRLAFGLPLGGSIEFADKLTLHTSLAARRPVE
ncbi:MAG: recombination mediator RecR [Synergistales bacterium]|nr:recombination mediator RecR [Synergistales bacterium]MDY6400907.1 recombination mediator RecR [Synergistales bacterium]MDY6410064.1 recombination mediator RecR [Synergistales bacterium]MDY6413714.1 recombination mediator RecR [Synergistales bacterium]MDY6422230.1 recombination mediator RecR [Synergistales bacterium]